MADKKKPGKQVSISPLSKGKGDSTASFKRSVKLVALMAQQEAHKEFLKSQKHFDIISEHSLKVSKCTESFIKQYCAELVKGHYPEVACRMLAVGYGTLGRWLKKGRDDYERIQTLDSKGIQIRPKDITKEHLLYINVEMALHLAEDRDLAHINMASMSGNWAAAAWKLERRHHQRWARKDQTEVNLNGQISGSIQHVIMTPDQAPSIEEWQKQKALSDSKVIDHVPAGQ